MKSLLFAPSLAFENRAAGGSKGRALTLAVIGAVLSLVIQLTEAYAQDPVTDFAGTVSCVETSLEDDGLSAVSIATDYVVELIGGTIVGRWGAGKDTIYYSAFFSEEPGEYSLDPESEINIEELLSELTATFWTMPVDGMCNDYQICTQYEDLYSETGWWKFRVHKDQLHIRGTSFVVVDYHFDGDLTWTQKTAKCEWDLNGPITSLELF